ncbi:DinB family protein [Bacillus sp. SCS-151]|uniref:DinB family protein n=1 Tax=Nanhaiella sioensis TaxID=3115293 RepID=UPI003978763E
MLEFELKSIEMIRNKVLATINGLSDEQLNKKVTEDRWSVAQLLNHLYTSELGFTSLIKAGLENPESKEAKKRPLLLMLDRSQKVKVPDELGPTDDFMTKDKLLQCLSESREGLLKVLNEMNDNEDNYTKGIPNPVFKYLNLAQSVEFIGLHELRHWEQLNEIIIDSFYVPVAN